MDSTISIFSSELVSCTGSSFETRLPDPMPLGPMDYSTPAFVPIDIAFVYQNSNFSARTDFSVPTSSDEALIPFSRLKRALSRVLDYYPHLTGRLMIRQSDKAMEMSEFGKGVLLVSARCNLRLDDLQPCPKSRITQMHLPDGGNSLIPGQEATIKEILEKPVLRVQHTRFACGSVALGFRITHVLCDAQGLFQLLGDLSEIYRQIRKHDLSRSNDTFNAILPSSPVIESYLKDFHSECHSVKEEILRETPWNFSRNATTSDPNFNSDPSNPIQNNTVPNFFLNEDIVEAHYEDITQTAPLDGSELPNTGKIARVYRFELDALKNLASKGREHKFTAFESLASHIHQQVLRARVLYAKSSGISLDTISTQFLFSVNQRRSDRLNLPDRYFPNAPICTFSSPPFESIAGPLCDMTAEFHEALTKITPQNAETSLRWIAALPDKTELMMPFMGKKLFTFTQWSGFDVYKGMNFDTTGDGRPIFPTLFFRPFSPEMLTLDGLCHIMPTEDQIHSPNPSHNSLDLTLIINEPLWKLVDSSDPIMSKFLDPVIMKKSSS